MINKIVRFEMRWLKQPELGGYQNARIFLHRNIKSKQYKTFRWFPLKIELQSIEWFSLFSLRWPQRTERKDNNDCIEFDDCFIGFLRSYGNVLRAYSSGTNASSTCVREPYVQKAPALRI